MKRKHTNPSALKSRICFPPFCSPHSTASRVSFPKQIHSQSQAHTIPEIPSRFNETTNPHNHNLKIPLFFCNHQIREGVSMCRDLTALFGRHENAPLFLCDIPHSSLQIETNVTKLGLLLKQSQWIQTNWVKSEFIFSQNQTSPNALLENWTSRVFADDELGRLSGQIPVEWLEMMNTNRRMVVDHQMSASSW